MFETEFQRIGYSSMTDGREDWYMVHRENHPRICLVYLHGHGSSGDQLMTRADITPYTDWFLRQSITIISPNLRGNAWMCDAAVNDLFQILETERRIGKWEKLLIVSGSMGGTGALIFAMRHPETVDGCGVLGAAVDPQNYLDWLADKQSPILQEIRTALFIAYPTVRSRLENSVLQNSARLSMPVYFAHGGADATIPVEGARALRDKLRGKKDFLYTEIPNGDHDSPLVYFINAYQWLEEALK